MIARAKLAVLRFNEAIKAGHALTNDQMPKTFVVKPTKIPQEKRYLMSEVIRMIYMPNSGKPEIPDIPTLYERPEKTDDIKIPFLTFLPILERICWNNI